MDITILFEDADIVVINKPAGLVVNRAESVKVKTVQDWMEKKSKVKSQKLKIKTEGDFYKRSGVVHRLDKDTSGALILAKNEEAFINIQKQFKERTIEKVYKALVHGKVKPEIGTIRAPIGRLPWNRKRFGVYPGGREAETSYHVEKYYINKRQSLQRLSFTMISFFPKSGRTHQIRVHAKYIGHPIVSDIFYAGKRGVKSDRKWCPRLFLHAFKITFTHPKTEKRIIVEAPLADDLQEVIKKLAIEEKND